MTSLLSHLINSCLGRRLRFRLFGRRFGELKYLNEVVCSCGLFGMVES